MKLSIILLRFLMRKKRVIKGLAPQNLNNICVFSNTAIGDTLFNTPVFRELKKAYPKSKITAIFQPHRYTRLKANLAGFKECFRGVDELIILPVYSAGEEPNGLDLVAEFSAIDGASSVIFANKIERNGDFIEFSDNFGVRHALKDGLVIGFGAGDISAQMRGI